MAIVVSGSDSRVAKRKEGRKSYSLYRSFSPLFYKLKSRTTLDPATWDRRENYREYTLCPPRNCAFWDQTGYAMGGICPKKMACLGLARGVKHPV
jgi:hypothetical protein